MTNRNIETPNKTSNKFLLGLILGAAAGALSAVLVDKSDDIKIVENFESKVKDFFRDLMSEAKTKKDEVIKKIEFIDVDPDLKGKEEKKSNNPRKSTPKMFVKPKK